MAVVAISVRTNYRLDDAEATTNWSKIGSSLAQEPDFKYQGTYAVSSKISTTLGGHYLSGATLMPADMTATGANVVMMKQMWTNKDVLTSNPAAALRIGSTSGNYYDYYIADDGTQGDIDYPPKGGFLINPVDPSVTAWRDGVTGTPNLASVDYIATTGNFTASSKSENVVTDAVDLSPGLWLVGGDSTDPDGTFQSFVDYDEGTLTNRIGHVSTVEGVIYAFGRLIIGRTSGATVTATVFTDLLKTIIFPGGLVPAGWNSIEVDLGNSTTVVTWNNISIVGRGRNNLKRWFDTANEVDGTNDEIDITGHGFFTGDAVLYSDEGGTAITGLTDNTEYFVEPGGGGGTAADSFALHLTRQAAYTGGTPIAITAAGTSATHSFRRQPDIRPDLDVVGTLGSLDIIDCTLQALREITLTSAAEIDGSVLVGCTKATLAQGLLTGCSIIDHLTAEGEAFVVTPDPSDIENCDFDNSEQEGHAIEVTSTTGSPYAMTGVQYTGYGPTHKEFNALNDVDDANDEVDITAHGFTTGDPFYYSDEGGTALTGLTDQTRYFLRAVTVNSLSFHRTKYDANNNLGKIAISVGSDEDHALYSANASIYNSSGGAVTINVQPGGGTPTIRNSVGSSTTVNNTVTLTVNVSDLQGNNVEGARVRIEKQSDGSLISEGTTNASGVFTDATYNYVTDTPVKVIVRLKGFKFFATLSDILSTGMIVGASLTPDGTVNLP